MAEGTSPVPEWSNPYAPPSAPELEPAAAPEPELALEPVKFWRRACARVLDLGVHIIVGALVGFAVGVAAVIILTMKGLPLDNLEAAIQTPTWSQWLSGIFGSLFFQTICEGWHGCSPGKRMLGIVVLQEDGSPCTPFQALKREIAFFVDSLFFGIVAASRMSESHLQQRIGDSWARTVVVYRRSAPARSLRSGLRFVTVFFLASMADAAALGLPYLFRLTEL